MKRILLKLVFALFAATSVWLVVYPVERSWMVATGFALAISLVTYKAQES